MSIAIRFEKSTPLVIFSWYNYTYLHLLQRKRIWAGAAVFLWKQTLQLNPEWKIREHVPCSTFQHSLLDLPNSNLHVDVVHLDNVALLRQLGYTLNLAFNILEYLWCFPISVCKDDIAWIRSCMISETTNKKSEPQLLSRSCCKVHLKFQEQSLCTFLREILLLELWLI